MIIKTLKKRFPDLIIDDEKSALKVITNDIKTNNMKHKTFTTLEYVINFMNRYIGMVNREGL